MSTAWRGKYASAHKAGLGNWRTWPNGINLNKALFVPNMSLVLKVVSSSFLPSTDSVVHISWQLTLQGVWENIILGERGVPHHEMMRCHADGKTRWVAHFNPEIGKIIYRASLLIKVIVVGSIVGGLAYGFLGPLFDTFKAVGEGYTDARSSGFFMVTRDAKSVVAPRVLDNLGPYLVLAQKLDMLDSHGWKMGNPQIDLQDQGVIDSGCSRHMTGNMSYLTNYKEIDGGYVAFGGNPKGGKITKKCLNEVVHKELGNSLVGAATTASSLEAEQDGGNINKTQSKATPNESSSLGTTSGGGPGCQETMGDIIAQSRRVKKLEKKNRPRTHKLKRLCKVGLIARVESSDNEESLGEDASKQERIDAIDADEEITLVSVQNIDEEIFDVNALDGEEVFIAEQEVAANEKDNKVNVVEEVVEVINTAKVITNATTVSATTTTTDDDDDITLAQALIEMKSTKPKNKGVVIQELGKFTTTISLQLSSQKSQDKGKGILIELVKPMKKKDQIRHDEETILKLQAEFDEEERLAREKAKKEKEANIALIETWDDI
ncbi:hypothetical protein Tco_1494242 [Tanacetum coccineum]